MLVDPHLSGTANRALRPPRAFTRDALRRGGIHEEARKPMNHADTALAFDSIPQARLQLPLDDVLPKHEFLKQLEREKRRTDRSKASLSMVLFRFDSRKGDPLDDVDTLLRVLCKVKRETDIVGYLSDELIAVLLPETDKQGTLVLTQKVVAHSGDARFSAAAATYPDRVFDDLKAEHQATPEPNPFFLGSSANASEGSYPFKRTLDIIGAIAGLVVLAPLMLVIAMAIGATSPGPVILKQIRLGKRGVPFNLYKFRSMHCNSEDHVHREYVARLIAGDHESINQGEATKPLYKMKNDPRVTRVGRVIRKTSMDELPQLLNILKGEMSLVGPRPPLPYEAEKYQSWHLRRVLEAKPGLTGLWQVNGRSKTSFDDMVRMDLRYTRTSSLALDLKILIKTVKIVVRGDGAN
jgi:lipopolysaccharide/colanic/teichoic acid biosynthesis glycosyltransferase